MPALVFDLGGTHLRFGIAEDSGLVRDVRKRRIDSFVNADTDRVWRDVVDLMVATVREAEGDAPRSPIVVSFPGPVNKEGLICNAPTLLGSKREIPNLAAQLRERTGRSVYLLNDVSAAAWYLCRTYSHERFLVVTVSSGIGSKMYDPTAGVLDDTQYSGEIGHVRVDFSADAAHCDCGGVGHLGAIASGRGIERAARKLAVAQAESFAKSACVQQFGADLGTLCNERHIVPALQVGDAWTLGIVRRCTDALARVLLNCILSAGLHRVVLIGGFALTGGEAYLRILREALCDACDYTMLKPSVASCVELGPINEEICLLGAARYARRIEAR